MPNWVEQHLHVVGNKLDIDRFLRVGFSRRNRDQFDDELSFVRLCPLGPRDRKDTYTHDSAVVMMRYRTRTQAYFGMMTSWNYPAEAYARLPTHWPSLNFICAVHGEMGDSGGILMLLKGEVLNLVQHYGAEGYSRAVHARRIRAALRRWAAFSTAGRDYRVFAFSPWEHRYMGVDAHFDDDFWFYFRSREEMGAFRQQYRTARPQRRDGETWARTRVDGARDPRSRSG